MEWHLQAFLAKDVDRIMEDYDNENLFTVYNDGCSPGVLREFKGWEIRLFYEIALADLNQSAVQFLPFDMNEPNGGNPSIEGDEVSMLAAHVFMVYKSLPSVEKASDFILFKQAGSVVKFKLTNLVTTQPGICHLLGFPPRKPVPDPDSKITQGWNAYLNAFVAQDKTEILKVFTNISVVQTYTMDVGYERYEGLDAIGTMFEVLWTAMNAQKDDQDSIGFTIPDDFPRVDVDWQSAFFVWSSYSNPKAANSFAFDLEGKILRQTLITVAGGQAPGPQMDVTV